MKRLLLFIALTVIFSATAFSQNSYNVKGTISDSVEHVKLGKSAVSILQAKDSILVKFGYAKADGTFMLDGLRKGKYILMIAYPDYADYAEQFSLDSAHISHDF